MLDALDLHKRIALQFSGGKDSLACLWLLRKHLDRITVYHVNSGDLAAEVERAVAWARELCPSFVEIHSERPQNTIPSDIVPSSATPFGLMSTGRSQAVIIDRFACCWATIMQPMHDAMKADGITLIIRGQKRADKRRSPLRSGDSADGFEFLFPVETWTDDEVLRYLEHSKVPIPACYRELRGMPDCVSCSAWWDEHRNEYLARNYPQAHSIVMQRMDYIREMISEDLQHMEAPDGRK